MTTSSRTRTRSPGDFEFNNGFAFASQVETLQIKSRAVSFEFCERLPCTYNIPGLYGRAGFRISVEIVVQYKQVLPLCDPWCSPTSWWWCIPCTGIVAQTALVVGGCAPFQEKHCGGGLSIWINDAGEVHFGFLTFVESFSILPLNSGGGLRIIDTSVPAKGFKGEW